MNRPLAIVVGCLVGSGLGCGDGASRPRIDASVQDVAAVDADPSCGQWRRETVVVTDVNSLEALPIHPERSARVLVTVQQCLTQSDGFCEGAHTCGPGSVEPGRGVCGWVGD